MSSSVASYASGSANAAAAANASAQQAYAQQLGLYASGPRKESLDALDANNAQLMAAYNDPSRQYIAQNAGTNQAYQAAINQGMSPSQAMEMAQRSANSLQDFVGSGRNVISAGQVSAGAQGLLDPSLINSQVDAYSRDISRNLGENVITGIRSGDIASGNLGSSRGGIQEAIARRGAEDRIADFRGGLVGDALKQSQSLLQSNISNEMGGYGALMESGSQIGGIEQQQLANLTNLGKLQQGLDQGDINNQIAERDYNVTQTAQLGSLLRDYASVGNLVDKPRAVKEYKPDSWAEAQFKF